MPPTSEDVAGLFSCQVYASAGDADRVSVGGLLPLRNDEIPSGFENWVEKRQREYRAGRHHARTALRAAGHEAAEVPRGLDGLPRFPDGFCGTITHTGRSKTFAAAAVCRTPIQIGLDAEFLRPLSEGMAELILTPEERERNGTLLGPTDPSIANEELWTMLSFSAKEAFYKCVFPRCRQKLGFHDARVWWKPDWSSFEVEAIGELCEEMPRRLAGRYLIEDSLVLCGVTWESSDSGA